MGGERASAGLGGQASYRVVGMALLSRRGRMAYAWVTVGSAWLTHGSAIGRVTLAEAEAERAAPVWRNVQRTCAAATCGGGHVRRTRAVGHVRRPRAACSRRM
eukprot:988913-Prymnesium_polylepis.1